jgi:hypothetical protein
VPSRENQQEAPSQSAANGNRPDATRTKLKSLSDAAAKNGIHQKYEVTLSESKNSRSLNGILNPTIITCSFMGFDFESYRAGCALFVPVTDQHKAKIT